MDKFNSLEKAQRYIQELGYVLDSAHNHKEDRSFLYKKGRWNKIFLRSTFDYLNNNTLEMGTVWVVQQF